MMFSPVTFPLKDGRTGVLRSPDPAKDAADLVQYLHDTAADTPFVLRTPEEISYTVEGEERFLRNVVDSPDECMLVCDVDGHIAGNCHLRFNGRIKTRHLCSVAIALRKAYWGNGIGSGLMERLIAFARGTGAEVISLEVRSDNDRAKALYRKFGFTSFGVFRKFFKLGEAYFDADYMNLYL